MFASPHCSAKRRLGLLVLLAALTVASTSRGSSEGEAVMSARAQLARAKASLASAEGLLGEAQARSSDPEQAKLIDIATATIQKQQLAVQQAHDRLDLLLGCTSLKTQLDQDLRLSKQQQDRMEAGVAELKEWTRQNQEAQYAAFQLAVNALLDGILLKFIESFDSKIAQAETKLRAMPTNRADHWHMEELAALRLRLERLKVLRDGFKSGHMTLSVMELWNQLHELSQEAHLTSVEISDQVRKLAGNSAAQEVAEVMVLQAAANDFEKRLLKANFPLVNDAIKLGNLLVDYSYEAARWGASRNRILQQYQLNEQELVATAALGCQIERSLHRLKACRGEPAPALSGRCQREKP